MNSIVVLAMEQKAACHQTTDELRLMRKYLLYSQKYQFLQCI